MSALTPGGRDPGGSSTVDVLILGAGPAGSTAARLLASWGYRVQVVSKAVKRELALVESLPPSTRKLLRLLDLEGCFDAAGFCPARGNTTWWAGKPGRVEPFRTASGDSGYQVSRPALDALLLDRAIEAGARVSLPASVTDIELGQDVTGILEEGDRRRPVSCRFVLDCTGRAGALGRRLLRRPIRGFDTLALVGMWERAGGFDLDDFTHTLTESFQDGWAWSVPVDETRRQFTVMVGSAQGDSAGLRGLTARYHAELSKTLHLSRLTSGARLVGAPWARDAAAYTSTSFAGPSHLLVGDAGSFIDPLSSIGVKKAMTSAWRAAVVANTVLARPGDAAMALDFHESRERAVVRACVAEACAHYRQGFECYGTSFWQTRSSAQDDASDAFEREASDEGLLGSPGVAEACDRLKSSAAIRLRRAPDATVRQRPEIVGREVVLTEALANDRVPGGLRFVGRVNLPQLVEIADQHQQVPDLYGAYTQRFGAVSLPDFLGALSVLLATGLLHNHLES